MSNNIEVSKPFRKPLRTVRKNTRNYKCPNCSGEFNTWEKERRPTQKVCPFCGLAKKSYEQPHGDSADDC